MKVNEIIWLHYIYNEDHKASREFPMKGHVVFNFSLFLVSLFLLSCGGGGSASLPPAQTIVKDDIRPEIILTAPKSEEKEWSITEPIRINFSESIKTDIDPSQVALEHLFKNGVQINSPAKLAPSFLFDTNKFESDVLVVPFVGILEDNSLYRVTVSGIKDLVGNSLAENCSWEFITTTTTGVAEILPGNTGLCGSAPTIEPPGKPQFVQAFSVDESTVLISWSPPSTVAVAEFYQIELSVDGGTFDLKVLRNFKELSFVDKVDPINQGLKRVYRITAGNTISGYSDLNALSNTVIPVANVQPITPKQVLLSDNPFANNRFAIAAKISPDGNTLAVFEPLGDIKEDPVKNTPAINDAGTVQLFTKGNMNKWVHLKTLSLKRGDYSKFDSNLTFSPDSKTFVIVFNTLNRLVEPSFVEVFSNTQLNGWKYISTLVPSAEYITSFAISADNSTLAIADYNGDLQDGTLTAGVVEIYSKNTKQGTSDWVYETTLISKLAGNRFAFGFELAFSPNLLYTTLAVSELTNGKGNVQLFTNRSGKWLPLTTLYSNSELVVGTGVSNRFGSNIRFSPDGETLAISEARGSVSSARDDIGTVQIFDIVNNVFSYNQKLIFNNNPSKFSFSFGDVVLFSPNSQTLAVTASATQSYAGAVEIFDKVDNGWVYNTRLMSRKPDANNHFGQNMTFSSNSKILAITENVGDALDVVDAGNVQLFYNTSFSWINTATLISSSPAPNYVFGRFVLFNQNTDLIIGEYRFGRLNEMDIGAVNIFDTNNLVK